MSSKQQPASYAAVANQYARDVVAGKILACRWIRLACQRHLRDLELEGDPAWLYRFDRKLAGHVCRFIELLPHTKGKWARKVAGQENRIRLEPWQIFKTCALFGWVDKQTGLRRFRKAYIKIPRKNAKSTWAAAVGLYLFAADGEYGAEVYSGATTEKQAWEVFRPAWLMAQKTPQLEEYFGVQVNAKSLVIEEDFSRFEPVIGKPGDGASPSCAIIDEFHEHLTPDLVDTMETGMGAREHALLLVITTAGSLVEGPCHIMEQEAQKVLEGVFEDEQLFALMYGIDEAGYTWNGVDVPADDWKSEAALSKANPNFDISVAGEFLRSAQREAIRSAHKQNTFKTKHLNVWVNAATGWMNTEKWRACGDATLRLEDFLREPCFEGCDLAAKVDLGSRCKLFLREIDGRRHYFAFWHHYVPEDTATDGDHPHYERWIDAGWLIAHPGAEIRLKLIQRDIEEDLERFDMRVIAFDPWNAAQMRQDLEEKLTDDVVIEVPQTTEYLSEAMKEVEAAVLAGRFHHNGDPLSAWAISNVLVKPDHNDNIFPRKEKHGRNKIDPASALFNAMNRAMTAQPEVGDAVAIFWA